MAWLSGWDYRKAIVIAHTDDGAQTDYQLKLLVGESAGATGEEVDCEGKVASDFDDLRFTTSDGETLCDYWIESITGTTPNQLATVWIEILTIAAHPDDTTIYMYYGGTETAVSSGVNTFMVFDDFERGNDGDTVGGDWTERAEHVHISTEQCYKGTRSSKYVGVDTTRAESLIPVTISSSIAVRFRYYKEDASWFTFRHADGNSMMYAKAQTDEVFSGFDGSSFVDTTLDVLKDSWGLIELNNFNWTADTLTAVVDGITKTGIDMSGGSNPAFVDFVNFGGSDVVGQDTWIDDFIVRNWTLNEPTWDSFGSEELAVVALTATVAITTSITSALSRGITVPLTATSTITTSITSALSRGITAVLTSTLAITTSTTASLSRGVKEVLTSTANITTSITSTLSRGITQALTSTVNITTSILARLKYDWWEESKPTIDWTEETKTEINWTEEDKGEIDWDEETK